MLKGVRGAGRRPVSKCKAMREEAGREMKPGGRGPCKPCSGIWTFSQRQGRITECVSVANGRNPSCPGFSKKSYWHQQWNRRGWAADRAGMCWAPTSHRDLAWPSLSSALLFSRSWLPPWAPHVRPQLRSPHILQQILSQVM